MNFGCKRMGILWHIFDQSLGGVHLFAWRIDKEYESFANDGSSIADQKNIFHMYIVTMLDFSSAGNQPRVSHVEYDELAPREAEGRTLHLK